LDAYRSPVAVLMALLQGEKVLLLKTSELMMQIVVV